MHVHTFKNSNENNTFHDESYIIYIRQKYLVNISLWKHHIKELLFIYINKSLYMSFIAMSNEQIT